MVCDRIQVLVLCRSVLPPCKILCPSDDIYPPCRDNTTNYRSIVLYKASETKMTLGMSCYTIHKLKTNKYFKMIFNIHFETRLIYLDPKDELSDICPRFVSRLTRWACLNVLLPSAKGEKMEGFPFNLILKN